MHQGFHLSRLIRGWLTVIAVGGSCAATASAACTLSVDRTSAVAFGTVHVHWTGCSPNSSGLDWLGMYWQHDPDEGHYLAYAYLGPRPAGVEPFHVPNKAGTIRFLLRANNGDTLISASPDVVITSPGSEVSTPSADTPQATSNPVPAGTIGNARPIVVLAANPTSLSPPATTSSILTWSSADATSCAASGGWHGAKPTAGTQAVSPTRMTIYALRCAGPGGSAAKSVVVAVAPAGVASDAASAMSDEPDAQAAAPTSTAGSGNDLTPTATTGPLTQGPSSSAGAPASSPKGSNNHPPMIKWIGPAGVVLTAPASVVLSVEASDPDGTVTQVAFYDDTQLIASRPGNPSGVYSYTWSNRGAGEYHLSAQAMDHDGAHSRTAPVTVTVVGGATNTAPVMTPTKNKAATAGVPMLFCARATDAENDKLTYRMGRVMEHMEFDERTGCALWNTTALQMDRLYRVAIQAQDPAGLRSDELKLRIVLACPGDWRPCVLGTAEPAALLGATGEAGRAASGTAVGPQSGARASPDPKCAADDDWNCWVGFTPTPTTVPPPGFDRVDCAARQADNPLVSRLGAAPAGPRPPLRIVDAHPEPARLPEGGGNVRLRIKAEGADECHLAGGGFADKFFRNGASWEVDAAPVVSVTRTTSFSVSCCDHTTPPGDKIINQDVVVEVGASPAP